MAVTLVKDISPGAILESDVKDLSGRLLLAKGGEITAKHLRIFKTWGITEADVAAVTAALTEPTPESTSSQNEAENNKSSTSNIVAELDDQVKDFFCLTDMDHPLIHELLKIHLATKNNTPIGKEN